MRTVFALFAAISGVTLCAGPAAAADAFPKFDIERNCKLETSEPSGIGETLQSCVADEQRARDELQPKWAGYSKPDQASCVRETSLDGTPSYVELLICLEMTETSGVGSH